MRLTRSTLTVAILASTLLAPPAWAQPKPPDPDWPCQQRLVPHLSAGSYWTAGAVPTGDYSWHDDPTLTDLIQSAVNRDTPDTDAAAALAHHIASLPPAARPAAATKLFGDIVDDSNDERDTIVSHIRQLARRQRNLDDTISSESAAIDKLPANDPQRPDLTGQRDFNIQTFHEAQTTIRYACEVPATYDRRLGLFARALGGQ